MGLFDRKKPQPVITVVPPSAPAAVDWSDIGNIRAEWPQSSLDPAADLQKFQQALALYARDDYASMMQCATLFATALAHSLYGPGILHGDDLPNTIHKTLYCACFPPPDGQTFAESAQKAARLAMTIMRENGWQPASLGGTTPIFEGKLNQILLGIAVGPPEQPWRGDLQAFFAVPPSPIVGPLPDEEDRYGKMIGRLHGTLLEAQAGDAASSLFMEGFGLEGRGDLEGALAKYSEAARLGSADAMASAGHMARDLGRRDESRFWYESAANSGHPAGMYNTAIAAVEDGDRATAVQWFQRAAEAGRIEGYAALTQLADEAGDEAAEARWAQLGAEAGQAFCMGRHGLLLVRGAGGDVPTLRRAREFLEQAGERGEVNAAALAVSVNHQLGDPARARRFADIVVQSGDAEQIDRLRRYGFL